MTMLRRSVMVGALAVAALALWMVHDFSDSGTHDLRAFDGHEVGRLETAMWRSYYEHRRLRLFAELTELLRHQFHLPFWKSCAGAFYAARAAVVFQAGHSHADYARALPDLNRYYRLIRRASSSEFNVERTASLELDWWIVHRERANHSPSDLYRALALLQAEIYGMPPERFAAHARVRGDAMLLRDAGAEAGLLSEADWEKIGTMLDDSWMSLRAAVAR